MVTLFLHCARSCFCPVLSRTCVDDKTRSACRMCTRSGVTPARICSICMMERVCICSCAGVRVWGRNLRWLHALQVTSAYPLLEHHFWTHRYWNGNEISCSSLVATRMDNCPFRQRVLFGRQYGLPRLTWQRFKSRNRADRTLAHTVLCVNITNRAH